MKRLVVKVGSGLLAGWGTHLDRGVARSVVTQLCDLHQAGRQVILVSSGAVALGCERLGLDRRPEDIPTVQAAAAIGQGDLMALYQRAFSERGLTTAQVLVTHADLADRRRFLNARHALERLIEMGVVPILNENDTVAVDELKVGDNDTLAAHVTNLVGAELLVLLTDQDGLHTADPRVDSEARRIPVVQAAESLPPNAVGPAGSSLSVGGMATKVEAARRAAAFGVTTVVANGRTSGVLEAVVAGRDLGTRFEPDPAGMGSRKAWISGLNPAGELRVDAGAARAVQEEGRSLLPAGLREVVGDFDLGAPVAIVGPEGEEIARGLAQYSATELRTLAGRRTDEIVPLLGFHLGDAAVHRDDLVLARTG